MNILFYIFVVVGSVMVYGSDRILRHFKLNENVKYIIGLKFAGLGVALIGILKLLKVY